VSDRARIRARARPHDFHGASVVIKASGGDMAGQPGVMEFTYPAGLSVHTPARTRCSVCFDGELTGFCDDGRGRRGQAAWCSSPATGCVDSPSPAASPPGRSSSSGHRSLIARSQRAERLQPVPRLPGHERKPGTRYTARTVLAALDAMLAGLGPAWLASRIFRVLAASDRTLSLIAGHPSSAMNWGHRSRRVHPMFAPGAVPMRIAVGGLHRVCVRAPQWPGRTSNGGTNDSIHVPSAALPLTRA